MLKNSQSLRMPKLSPVPINSRFEKMQLFK